MDVVEVVVTPAPAVIEVIVAGPQGPAGPAGPGAAGYTHTQVVAATVVTVQHNLGYRPAGIRAIHTVDDIEWEGTVAYSSTLVLIVTFLEPFAGPIYVS